MGYGDFHRNLALCIKHNGEIELIQEELSEE
jgi:hypothetical protein